MFTRSFSTMAVDSPFGPTSPDQPTELNPAKPDSAKVGTFGRMAERAAPPIASGRSLPLWMPLTTAGNGANVRCDWLPMTAVTDEAPL